MKPETAAAAIVERFLLKPGQTVSRITRRGEVVRVRTDRTGWLVNTDHRTNTVGSYAYTLCEVRPDLAADPPSVPRGFAILPGDRIFDLTDPEEFKSFCIQAGTSIASPGLINLLARYQARQRPAVAILDPGSVSFWLSPDRLEEIPGFTYPEVTHGRNGSMTLTFCSLHIESDSPVHRPRIGLARWEVKLEIDGRPDWSTRPLAQAGVDRRAGARWES